MLPIVILLWFLGWSLYCIGAKKDLPHTKLKPIEQAKLTFITSMPEQQYAT